MEEKNAIDFLLYSYFGVTTESEWKMCVKAAIVKAYNDATMEGAYNTLIPKKNIDLRKKSDSAKKEAAKLIKTHIKELFTSYSGEFDKWHSTLCEEIKNKYSNVNSENTLFTYGNAQKWVNMTIKYICILDLLNHNHDYHDNIEKYMKHFHVPVDSYIIEATWKDTQIKIPVKNKNKDRGKYNSEKVKTWSKWEKTDYTDFQDSLKIILGNKKPLEWEAETWVKQSEIRKKNEKQAKRDTFFKENNPL